MDPDLDPFGDIIPAPPLSHSTRAGGKFQPKAKQRPVKAKSGSVPTEFPSNAKEKVVTIPSSSLDIGKFIQPVDATGASLTNSLGAQEPLESSDKKNCQSMNSLTQGDSRSENRASLDALPAEVDKFGGNSDRHSDLPECTVEFNFRTSSGTTPESAEKAGGMFQSQARLQDAKETFATCIPDSGNDQSVTVGLTSYDSAEPLQDIDVVFEDPISLHLATSMISGARKPLKDNDGLTCHAKMSLEENDGHDSGFVNSPQKAGSLGFGLLESDTSNSMAGGEFQSKDKPFPGKFVSASVSLSSSCRKEEASALVCPDSEAISMEFDLDPFSDITPETAISKARAGGKFQPRAKVQPKRVMSVIASPDFTNSMKGKPISDGMQSAGVVNAADSRLTNPVGQSSATLESDVKVSEAFHVLETQDILSEVATVSHAVESVGFQPNAGFVSAEAMNIDEGSISAISSDDFVRPDPTTSQCPVNEDQTNASQSSGMDTSFLHAEDVCEVPDKESSDAKKGKDSLSNIADEVNEGGISSRQLRKRTTAPQYVDEPESDAENSTGELPGSSLGDEEDKDPEYRLDEDARLDEEDPECNVKSASQKRGSSGKAKKLVSGKEKPVRKNKRADATPAQSKKEPPKKFPHSTRRKKRCVNKDLLKIPEDELDLLSLPIRDVILLAEFKERLAAKEAKASKRPSTTQRDESLNEGGTYASEQGEDHTKAQANGGAQSSFPLFNHHSFMDRTPTARWSKQDTELFYEGIQHFGTDLSMIQLLFPGRTRHQIKLKLKKEERQCPLRVNEALKNPVKDHSCFEKAFEQLRQAGLRAEQESNRDDSVGVTGNEEAESITNTNEGVAKSEQIGEGTPEDHGTDVGEVKGSLKSGDSEDELDIWSSYKSEV